MDDETIRRPFLITLAAIVWFVVGTIMIVLCLGWLIYAVIGSGFKVAMLVTVFFWPIVVGVLWILLGYRLMRGRYADVIGVCIASLILSTPLLICGVVGAMNAIRPLKLELAYSLASITIGTWLVLSGVFVMVSRDKYRRWVQARNRNVLRPRLEEFADDPEY